MALDGEAFERDVTECLYSKGWNRNRPESRLPVYCADKEAAISCKPGGTEQMYTRDRAECTDRMVQVIGTRYATPGWWGLGGLIVSSIQTYQNKTALQRSQLQYMKICLEAKDWVVTFKGETKALMGSDGVSPAPSGVGGDTGAYLVQPQPLPGGQREIAEPPSQQYAPIVPDKYDRGAAPPSVQTSKWSYAAEQVVKANSCVAPIATMNYSAPGAEAFTVTCGREEPISVRCDFGTCRVLK